MPSWSAMEVQGGLEPHLCHSRQDSHRGVLCPIPGPHRIEADLSWHILRHRVQRCPITAVTEKTKESNPLANEQRWRAGPDSNRHEGQC